SLLSRLMDVIWAFPVYLLAISISTELLTHSNGFQFGPVHVQASSLWLPTVIIAFIYIPYVYRPMRGQVLSVGKREFVAAAPAQGAGNLRLIFSEILPNVVSTVSVLLPLIIATTILTEAALSFLGVGVQPPNVSWGTIIQDGTDLVYTRPWVTIAPGLMILLTVLSLNVLGDGVRDALDPRAKLRGEGWCTRGAARVRARARRARQGSALMLTFIIRLLLWTVLVMFVITVVVFIIFFKTPGVDPARALAGRSPNAQTLAEIRAQLGLDRPFPIEYGIM